MIKIFWAVVFAFIILLFLVSCKTTPETAELKTSENWVQCGANPLKHKKHLHASVLASTPPHLTWIDVEEEGKAEQFISAFNASSPPSNVKLDAAVRLYHRFDSMNLLLVLSDTNGCILTAVEMPRPQVILWLQGVPTKRSSGV